MNRWVGYTWRNKKTGRYCKPHAKGSKRYVTEVLRWEKGSPKAGQVFKSYTYKKSDFVELKSLELKGGRKNQKGMLNVLFSNKKIYSQVRKSGAKILMVNIEGTDKNGKLVKDKLIIDIKGLTGDKLKQRIVGRIIEKVKVKGFRLSSAKNKSDFITPTNYQKLKLLSNFKIKFSRV